MYPMPAPVAPDELIPAVAVNAPSFSSALSMVTPDADVYSEIVSTESVEAIS
jgi:hypothetical protein